MVALSARCAPGCSRYQFCSFARAWWCEGLIQQLLCNQLWRAQSCKVKPRRYGGRDNANVVLPRAASRAEGNHRLDAQ